MKKKEKKGLDQERWFDADISNVEIGKTYSFNYRKQPKKSAKSETETNNDEKSVPTPGQFQKRIVHVTELVRNNRLDVIFPNNPEREPVQDEPTHRVDCIGGYILTEGPNTWKRFKVSKILSHPKLYSAKKTE